MNRNDKMNPSSVEGILDLNAFDNVLVATIKKGAIDAPDMESVFEKIRDSLSGNPSSTIFVLDLREVSEIKDAAIGQLGVQSFCFKRHKQLLVLAGISEGVAKAIVALGLGGVLVFHASVESALNSYRRSLVSSFPSDE
ncbi:hypothetical protein HYV44_00295 [Candidatus Microgenomates bacterium]|nr:hypothetical protein [Candidatus Microgenomates bacterium]